MLRLAAIFSSIGGVYRRKAVVRDWFPNGESLTVKGKVEFYQQTEYDITNVEVDIEGLEDASGYHVHIVSPSEHPTTKLLTPPIFRPPSRRTWSSHAKARPCTTTGTP